MQVLRLLLLSQAPQVCIECLTQLSLYIQMARNLLHSHSQCSMSIYSNQKSKLHHTKLIAIGMLNLEGSWGASEGSTD